MVSITEVGAVVKVKETHRKGVASDVDETTEREKEGEEVSVHPLRLKHPCLTHSCETLEQQTGVLLHVLERAPAMTGISTQESCTEE